MLGASIISRVRAAASRFIGANQGNIAVIFAIAAVPVISFVGAAIDYTRANSARSSMQAALDSTALMLSKDLSDGLISLSDDQYEGSDLFRGALHQRRRQVGFGQCDLHHRAPAWAQPSVVNGSGAVTTDFMKVAGFPNINFNTSSTSAWGNTRMRVAMVLDNTGSMDQNDKMPAMQEAARTMVTTLSGYNKQDGDVYISIIPFAKDVNVGTSNQSTSPGSTGRIGRLSRPFSRKRTIRLTSNTTTLPIHGRTLVPARPARSIPLDLAGLPTIAA